MRLAVLGTGYVGLVAGAGFADFGNDVTCVDSDEIKIARLNRGDMPIYEPGLDARVARSTRRGNLRFSSDLAGAVGRAEVVFIAVGTPASPSGAAAGLNELALEVVAAAERANERQRSVLADKVLHWFADKGGVGGRTVALWGMAFKPGTDDVREAPAMVVTERLVGAGAKVVVHDPVAMDNARQVHGDRVGFAPGMYQAAEGADALVLVTEWHEFRRPDFARLKSVMRGNALFDGRNVWDADAVRALGFAYHGIGRR